VDDWRSMEKQMNDLRETTSYPSFLEKAGFVEREEHTIDFVRWVWFEKTIDSVEFQLRLVVQVEFELSISDGPSMRDADNFSYNFNGVYLQILELPVELGDNRSCDREEFLKHPRTLPVNYFFVKEEPRKLDRFELRVTTRTQLRSLCKMLGCKD
jgi:hypothetical protein